MKIIISLLYLFILTGCGSARIERAMLEMSESLCTPHKGISSIVIDPILWSYVTCVDGTRITLEIKTYETSN